MEAALIVLPLALNMRWIKMDMDDLINQFTEDLTFDALLIWADILGVEHDENTWHKEQFIDEEIKLRDAVAEAMGKVGT